MSNVEKISIALPKELVVLLKDTVAEGNYSSSSEIVREALRDWKEKQKRQATSLKELRRLWREGVKSGPGRFSSIDEVFEEARRQFEAEKAKN